MSATIVDIARAANVSPSTVSRALSGKGRIGEETRNKVRKIAQELGYVKEPAQANTIGILYTSRLQALIQDSFFYGLVMEGAEATLRQWNYTTFFSTIGDLKEDLRRIERLWRHAGYLLVGGDIPEPLVRELKARGTHIVLVDYELADASVDAVVIDNARGIQAAVRHLVELGHEEIAYIGGPRSHPSLNQRHEAFLHAVKHAGLPVRKGWVRSSDDPRFLGSPLGYREFLQMAAGEERPTAVVCANDFVAQGVIEAALELGLKVPGDLSVVGFDDVPTQFGPPLTTVRVHKDQLGSMAAARLYELTRGRNVQPARIEVSTQLVVRESTAPPPSRRSAGKGGTARRESATV